MAPTVAFKVAQKEKNNIKDNRSFKKAIGPSIGVDRMDQQQKSLPPLRHWVGKGLTMGKCPTLLGPV